MDEMNGLNSTCDYADKALMSPENLNLIIPTEYHQQYYNLISSSFDHQIHKGMFGSEDFAGSRFQCSVVPDVASVNIQRETCPGNDQDEQGLSLIKAKIASHPSYCKLLDAYIDCQKVGVPTEIACLLDEIKLENDFCNRDGASSTCLGVDPELDDFMETYCEILVKYKSDLSRPFDEATSFLNKIETQLGNLCKDDGGLSSDEEFIVREIEIQDTPAKSEDLELKDRLLQRYGNYISSLKREFSKKKKKGKLPNEARQTLLQWWNVHYKWPYPTEADKISLAESTGLDQKQINNWFINQRKRHWKPSEDMQLAVMNNLSGPFFTED